ncbi:MAG TPA: hypothetical protein VJQ25_11420, partial [Nitrospira sp.]|nr:hypothetical protein [Nitrospira sp.]
FPVNPGEYSKHVESGLQGDEIVWLLKVPTGGAMVLLGRENSDGTPCHWIQENEDGTITVQSYPPDAPPERQNSNSILWNGWHGYIHNGVFKEL